MHRENKGECDEADAVKRNNVADRNQYLSSRKICWELGQNLIVAAEVHQKDPNHSRSSVFCTIMLMMDEDGLSAGYAAPEGVVGTLL